MAYEALYRRYRPGRFADVTGQTHVMTALRNAVANDRVGHAYLFSGPRGTGKTTSARILAKALNCLNQTDGEPCDNCSSCDNFAAGTSYDLRELDAASNNGVEAMRDLISKVGLSAGGHGVFILDEVHMLSTGAENALLKTLEEPPPNVTFILATTEPNKVVATIRSRTQHFDFTLLNAAQLTELVTSIAADDKMTLTESDVEWVVRAGQGSARDTLSALDQVVAAGGAPDSSDHSTALLGAIAEADTGAALVAINEATQKGREPELIGRALLADLRNAFLAVMGADLAHLAEADQAAAVANGAQFGPAAITRALDRIGTAIVDMRQAPDPRVDLELAVVRLTRPSLDQDPAAILARLERLESGAPAVAATAVPPVAAPPPAVPAAAPAPNGAADAAAVSAEVNAPEDVSAPEPPVAAVEPVAPVAAATAPPVAAVEPVAPVAAAPEAPVAHAAAPPPAVATSPEAAAPPPAAAPQSPGGAGRPRPADAARRHLRPSGDTAPAPVAPDPGASPTQAAAPADVPGGSRPTLGSMRRSANAAGVAEAAASSAPPPMQEHAPPVQPVAAAVAPPVQQHAVQEHAAPDPSMPPAVTEQAAATDPPAAVAPLQDPAAPPAVSPPSDSTAPAAPTRPAASPAGPSGTTAVPTLEAAQTAWHESILGNLPGRVKSRFSAGEFVAGAPGTLAFALPNDVHRQRCEDVRSEVDAALTAHFGGAVPLQLVVGAQDFASPEGPEDSSTPAAAEHESIDLDSLTDATDVAGSFMEQLEQTFPGSETLPQEGQAQ